MTNEAPMGGVLIVQNNNASDNANAHYGHRYSNNTFNISYHLPAPDASSAVDDRIGVGNALLALDALATAVNCRLLQVQTANELQRRSIVEGAAQVLDFKDLMQSFRENHNSISQTEALPLLTLLENAVHLFDRLYPAVPVNIAAGQDISGLEASFSKLREQNAALRQYQSLVPCSESGAPSHRPQINTGQIMNMLMTENDLLQRRVDDLRRQLDDVAQTEIPEDTPTPSLSIRRSELATRDWYVRSESQKVAGTDHRPHEGRREQKFKAMLRLYSDGELRERETILRRQLVESRLLVWKSSICAPLTFGISLVGTAWGGRQWHAASLKLPLIYEELEARGLLTEKDESLWELWTEMYHSGVRVNTFPLPKLLSRSD